MTVKLSLDEEPVLPVTKQTIPLAPEKGNITETAMLPNGREVVAADVTKWTDHKGFIGLAIMAGVQALYTLYPVIVDLATAENAISAIKALDWPNLLVHAALTGILTAIMVFFKNNNKVIK